MINSLKRNLKMKKALLLGIIASACVAQAEFMDRPVGYRIGERITIKPYVSLSSIFDSNVDGNRYGEEDVVWVVNPGLGFEYLDEMWSLNANAFYQYNAYAKDTSKSGNAYDYHGYGQDVTFRWADSERNEKGWGLMLFESYRRVDQSDDMTLSDGTGYSRDRDELKFAAAVQRRFNEYWHSELNTGYYWLDYNNTTDKYSSWLYGWSRWTVGGEVGFAPSKWTDFLLAASYQGYDQDNTDNIKTTRLSGESEGLTIQTGIGSWATERISYRVLAGWSRFEYSEDVSTSDGFTYTIAGCWKIGETWKTMLSANSYYQPSEREYATAVRVDAISWGIAKSLVRGKVTATFDVSYRSEKREYSYENASDYDLDWFTSRLGVNYIMNRYVTLFARAEYQQCWGDGSVKADYYDYDRFRGTVGLRFTY